MNSRISASGLALALIIALAPAAQATDPLVIEGNAGRGWEVIADGDTEPDQDVTNFGTLAFGETLIRSFRITNNSGGEVTVTAATSQHAEFDPQISLPTVIPDRAVAPFTIEFTAAIGPVLTNIEILSDAPESFSAYSFALFGVGEVKDVYVDASVAGGTANGLSWGSAFATLQDALDFLGSATTATVHVAAGVYFPDEGSNQIDNDRDSTFALPDGVTLLGGYPPGGGLQDHATHTTILSGDLEQNDYNIDGNMIAERGWQLMGTNASSVVEVAGKATLSGLTITAGKSDTGPRRRGAGIRATNQTASSDLTIDRCVIIGCYCIGSTTDPSILTGGSAISIFPGKLQMSATTLTGNRAEGIIGGGTCEILTDGLSKITDCQFVNNESISLSQEESSGAELAVSGDFPIQIDDTTFTGYGRNAGNSQNLLAFHALPEVRFERCRWVDNRTRRMFLFTDCPQVEFESCAITGNAPNASGFVKIARLMGNYGLNLLNCTIAGNRANGVFEEFLEPVGAISVTNCIIFQSSGGLPLPLSRSHSYVGGYGIPGNGNFPNIDSPFVDPRPNTAAPTADGDYRLLPDSPLIDAGLNASNPATLDLDGLTRVLDGDGSGDATIDIGAYESPTVLPIPVKITRFTHDSATGEVVLTVEASRAVIIRLERSSDMSHWFSLGPGMLNAGTTPIGLSGPDYGWPDEEQFFRIVVP